MILICLFSVIGVFLEVSFGFDANIYIITLPFLLYLIVQHKPITIIFIVIEIVLISLHTDNLIKNTVIFGIGYYIISTLLAHFEYNERNILTFTLVQIVMYVILSYGDLLYSLKSWYLIANIIGFLLFNYVYVTLFIKQEMLEGKKYEKD